MKHKLFLFLTIALTAKALEFEGKEDFSYVVGLGNLEFYLRNGFFEIKECYGASKEDYKKVLLDFEKDLRMFSDTYKRIEEKNVINRILNIVKILKQFQEDLTVKFQNINPESALEFATYVDTVRRNIKNNHDKHYHNIKNPQPWFQKDFEALEVLFKPKREVFMKKANEVVNKIVKCMDVPKCNALSK